ncbi:copper-transporting ATPase, putative [Plasmodium chabaudi chabaudi]|uniref:Copper-transporting ATPase, putative n=1 Tax=Plasmodium chabaudi chabaudi TaxID=31271 RepID=A0A1C6X5Z4_PLACU|nr:copper-transporting ATPase, putative [Plasmodium chabaudi chabaudi]
MMGKKEIILNNVSKNVKKQIGVLKIDGVENITFTNKSASIIYNNNIVNALEIVDTINNIGINGYFIEDEDAEGNGGNSNDIIRFTFYVNGNYNNNNNENVCSSQANISPHPDEISSKACGDNYVELGGCEENEKHKIKSCCEMKNKANKSNANEDKEFDRNGIEKDDLNLNKCSKNNEPNGDSNNNYIDQGSIYKYRDSLETNSEIINMCNNKYNENAENNTNVNEKNGKDEDNLKKGKKTYGVFNIFRNITKNKKIKSNDDIKPENKKLLDDTENIYNEDTVKPKGINHNKAFNEYENYINNSENIYICELRIYNMTCDSCGNKIINFLKNKNLIIDGNSFATDDKIKLKINIPENMNNYNNGISDGIKSNSNNVKFYVNKIMSEIKDSGFNNDLIDLYKYDNVNDNNLFDITLYIYRDDIIKAYNLLVQVKGVKKVEYDIQHEYIYILYDPDIIGIRCMLELLKKKNNIDAYYDEDKEKYFRSTKNNETQASRKVIELLCCFVISIIIIILNSYQMGMGNMDTFYAYGNYKHYFKTFKYVHNLDNKHKVFNNNFFEKDNISLSQNIPFDVSHKLDNNSNENVEFRKKKKQKNDEEKIKKKQTEIASNADLKKKSDKHNLNGEKDNCSHTKDFEDCISKEEKSLDHVKGKHTQDGLSEETVEKKTPKCADKDNTKKHIKKKRNDDQNRGSENADSLKNEEHGCKSKESENADSLKKDDHNCKSNDNENAESLKTAEQSDKRQDSENANSLKKEEHDNKNNDNENVDSLKKDEHNCKSSDNENAESLKKDNQDSKNKNIENTDSLKKEERDDKNKDSENADNLKKGEHDCKSNDNENAESLKTEEQNDKNKDSEHADCLKKEEQDNKNKGIENCDNLKTENQNDKNKDSGNGDSLKKEIDEEANFLFDFTVDNKSSKDSEDNKNLKKPANSKKLPNSYARFMKKAKPKNVESKVELIRSDKNENNSNKENNVDKCEEQKIYNNDKKNCEQVEKEEKTRIRKNKSGSEKTGSNTLLNKLLHTFIDDKKSTGVLDKKIFNVLSLRLLLIYILSSIIYLFFGYNFIINGYKNLKNNIINMNVLIFISSSFSYFYSLFLLISCIIFSIDIDGIPLYFDTAALLICILKLGFEIEHFLVQFSKKKMEDLYEKTTKHVNILEERDKVQEDNSNLNKKEKTNSSNKLIKKESSTCCGDDKNEGGGKSASNDLSNCDKNKSSKSFTLKKYLSSNAIDNGKPTDLSKDIDKICLEGKKINLNDYVINSYPVKFIQKYDLLVFYQGETILVDGIKMNDDVTVINESMISGESNGINKYKGDKIYAGSKCAEGICILYISDVTKRNYIEYVKKILDEVNSKKTDLQLYADKIASIFIPFIIILCIVIFLIWFYLTYFGYVNIRNENYFKLNRFLSCMFFSIHFSLSVLCVACPCAVGLASPLSIAISSYICSNIGIIIKNINIFEILLNCNHFIFDKTGTLTVGKPVVNKIFISNNFETFIDQLLKDRPGNNLEIDWEYAKNIKNMGVISNNDEVLENNSNYRDGGIGFFKGLGGSKGISDAYNKIEDYEKVSNCQNGEYMEVYDMHDNDPSNLLKHCKGKKSIINPSQGKNMKDGKKCLNYLESFNCAGKNVKFYCFSTENDNEYKMRKAMRLKQIRQREGGNKNRDENDAYLNCSGKQTFLNYFMSLVNLKKYRQYNNKNINSSNKYDKSFDKSLKEHFINNSAVEFSSDDDSYSSETSSEYNLTGSYNNKKYSKSENHGNYLDSNYGNHYDNNLIDVVNHIGNNNMINSSNNLSFSDEKDLKEKICNWIYLFLGLSLNVEKYSNHLYAESINSFINSYYLINNAFDVNNIKNEKNQGITGIINELSITIGTLFYCYTKYKNTYCNKMEKISEEKLNIKNFEKYLYSCDCSVHKTYQFLYKYSNSKKNENHNMIFMGIEGIIVGFFILVDDIKPQAFDLINHLKEEKKQIYVCTGDNYTNAIYISKILGIPKSNVSSNTLPMEKAQFVKKIQALNDGKVCIIGDGINDCFALKTADLGLSLCTRSNIVMDSADGCIVDNDISAIIKLFEISKKTILVIKFNFLFSFFINIFFILLASGAFYALDFVFSPFHFTFLMFCSSIIVILSSLSLKLILKNV